MTKQLSIFQNLRRKGGSFDHRPGLPKGPATPLQIGDVPSTEMNTFIRSEGRKEPTETVKKNLKVRNNKMCNNL